MKTSLFFVTLVGVALAVMGTAMADVTYVQDLGGMTGQLYGGGLIPAGTNCYVGESQFQAPGSTFYGFCIDLGQFISPGSTGPWNVVDLSLAPVELNSAPYMMGGDIAAKIEKFWAAHYGEVWTGTHYNATQGAAMQAAIWELVYQRDASGYNVLQDATSGNGFKVVPTGSDASWATLANTWLQNPSWTTNTPANLQAMVSRTTQDFVIIGQGMSNNVVPAPAAIVLGALGLGLIGWSKKRLVKDD